MEECDCLALHLSFDYNEVACREMNFFDFSCRPIISSLVFVCCLESDFSGGRCKITTEIP